MTDKMGQKPARRGWLIATPLIAVIVAFAAWSGFWVYASGKVSDNIAAVLEREAARGNIFGCDTREQGGYPFRFEVTCSEPMIELGGGSGRTRVTAKRLVAVAQVYNPAHVIVDIEGPLTAKPLARSNAEQVTVEWMQALSSIRFDGIGGNLEELRLIIEEPVAVIVNPASTSDGKTIATSQKLEVYARRIEGETPPALDPPAPDPAALDPAALNFETLTRASAVKVPLLRPTASSTGLDAQLIEMRGSIFNLPAPLTTDPRTDLARWQRNGGSFDLTALRLETESTTLVSSGRLALDATGRIDADIDMAVAGAPSASGGGGISLSSSDPASMLLGAVALLGQPAEIDGKPARKITVPIRSGKVAVGPFQLGQIPPAF